MFGLFKKNPERDFEFHKERTEKLLDDALAKFIRADDYMCGIGIGNDQMKLMSAQGAASKAQSSLKEAMYNANECLKNCQGNFSKKNSLREAVNSILGKTGNDLFVNPSTVKTWDDSRNAWLSEFSNIASKN